MSITPKISALRIGVIGASYAARTHLPTYAVLPEVDVVAVATARRETAEATARRFGIARAHVGFEALCDDPDVDLVVVATRPGRHRPMVDAALAAGKHVLCEVPFAASVTDGAAMAAAAAARGRLGIVDLQSRFWPAMTEFGRLVDDGYLGTIQSVDAQAIYPTFTVPSAVGASSWCAEAANGASSLRVHGLHTADLVQYLFGPIDDAQGVAATRLSSWSGPDGPVPVTSRDTSAFTGTVAGGAVCSVRTSWVSRHSNGFRLTARGSDGTLEARADGHTGHFPIRLTGARAGDDELRALPAGDGSHEVPEVAEDAATFSFARLVRRLAGAISSQDPVGAADAVGLPTFADGLDLLRLADAVDGGHPAAVES